MSFIIYIGAGISAYTSHLLNLSGTSAGNIRQKTLRVGILKRVKNISNCSSDLIMHSRSTVFEVEYHRGSLNSLLKHLQIV